MSREESDGRWQSARDLADELTWIAEAGSQLSGPGPAVTPRRGAPGSARLAWSAAAIFLLAAIAVPTVTFLRRAPVDTRVYRSTILAPANLLAINQAASRMALSPDGRRLAFVGSDATGQRMWVRSLDGLAAQPLAGTEGAAAPFWSPDSRFLAFVAGNKLKKIDPSGGPVLTICDATNQVPGSWNRDDVIPFTPSTGSPLFRVSAAGGAASPVTTLDTKAGETAHAFPFFLPDGRHFFYLAQSSGVPRGVYFGSLDSTDRTRLLEGGSNVQYAQGFLFFMRATTLMAQPFDVTRQALTGVAVPVAERLQTFFATSGIRTGAFSVSDTGVLVYHEDSSRGSQLVWFDRAGKQAGVLGGRADYADVFLSPDGTRASVSVAESGEATRDIWVFDVARGLRTRFTFDPEDEFEGPWSPDGSRKVFNSRRRGHMDLYQKAASGAGNEELLLEDSLDKYPQSWSPDGRFILYVAVGATTGQDLWVLPLFGDRKPFPFRQTRFFEGTGQFSPDGHWIAYSSNETGRNEVYVAPFPGPVGKHQISTAGGWFPRWRRDGKEIFYLTTGENSLMSASVTVDTDRVEVGTVKPLFDVRRGGTRWSYDVTPDGQRFLVNTLEEQNAASITLVVNWTAALKK